ncbi:MAG: SUMF1/EgtB/PvdO family nonheme iron enzyme [Deltaproteobacteria bacterium]|nr:SUMF1/EgtB/PvdO family nonheme iron enzyme [Deltaproteobacteria bacterium]
MPPDIASSSDTSVATASVSGSTLSVNGVSAGSATITVSDSGSGSATVSVTVLSTYTNSLGQTFVLLPAGTFTMGSPSNELGRDSDEGPQHRVTLSQSFYIQQTEITQSQWEAIMGSNPSSFQGCSNCPVDNVSFNDVQLFIGRMNDRKEGTYRLPTEAEWEYAARAGSTTAFYNGSITETECGYDPNLNAIGWYCYNCGDQPHPVAQKTPNAWGLYDMSGNVLERCQDWYDSDYYTSEAVIDPVGPSSGSYRIKRGGCWVYRARSCRSASRQWAYTDFINQHKYVGFRLVRQTESGQELGINPSTLSLSAGQTGTCTISGGTSPYSASSSNTSVATVSVNGSTLSATGVSAGSASITVSDSASGSAIVSVTVSSSASGTKPTVETGWATALTASSATLNATVNPNGESTTAYFQYGTTDNYGSNTSTQNMGSGTSKQSVTSDLSGLSTNTTYHYRIVATSSEGTSYGDDRSFTTRIFYVEPSGVCGGNSPCYTTIQAAIDAASSGGVIRIANEAYDESLSVGVSEHILLEGGWNTSFTTRSAAGTGTGSNVSGTMRVSGDWSGAVRVDGVVLESGEEQDTVAFSDNFNDGNFDISPAWTEVNKDDRPGTVSVINYALRVYRTGAYGNGGSVGIEIETDIPVNDGTKVSFDGKAVSRDVGDGCGWTCGEFPVVVYLYLEDSSGNELFLKYALNYGDAIENRETADWKQIAMSVPQGEWVRNINYIIRDAWPNAAKITKIYLFGNGWDFEGYMDNIRILSSP